MVDLVSVVVDDRDVFEHLTKKLSAIDKWSWKLVQKLMRKIRDQILTFVNYWMFPDWRNVLCLKWSIYELRVSIPGMDYLVRIVFYSEKDELVLLTWSLIKPVSYKDKQTVESTKEKYDELITFADSVAKDYQTSKQYSYIFIPLLPL